MTPWIYLGADAAGRECLFQDIPIQDSLRSLLSYEVMKQMSISQTDVLSDLMACKAVKDNALINQISLVFVNSSISEVITNHPPSGKKKHEELAVYSW